MIQITNNVYAVEVPSMAFGFDINNYGNSSELMYMLSMEDIADDDNAEETLITKPLPPGTWRFLFTTKTATEEDARKVVKQLNNGVYHDYAHSHFDPCDEYAPCYLSAGESLHSLLRSKYLDPDKNYALIEKQSSDE